MPFTVCSITSWRSTIHCWITIGTVLALSHLTNRKCGIGNGDTLPTSQLFYLLYQHRSCSCRETLLITSLPHYLTDLLRSATLTSQVFPPRFNVAALFGQHSPVAVHLDSFQLPEFLSRGILQESQSAAHPCLRFCRLDSQFAKSSNPSASRRRAVDQNTMASGDHELNMAQYVLFRRRETDPNILQTPPRG